jgi:hypothetical protein
MVFAVHVAGLSVGLVASAGWTGFHAFEVFKAI